VRHHVASGCYWCERCLELHWLHFRCFASRRGRRYATVMHAVNRKPGICCAIRFHFSTAWKVTEIGRISVVLYDSVQFVGEELQLTE